MFGVFLFTCWITVSCMVALVYCLKTNHNAAAFFFSFCVFLFGILAFVAGEKVDKYSAKLVETYPNGTCLYQMTNMYGTEFEDTIVSAPTKHVADIIDRQVKENCNSTIPQNKNYYVTLKFDNGVTQTINSKYLYEKTHDKATIEYIEEYFPFKRILFI